MLRTQSTYEPSVEVVDQAIEDDSLLAVATVPPMPLARRESLTSPSVRRTSLPLPIVAQKRVPSIATHQATNATALAGSALPPVAAIATANNNTMFSTLQQTKREQRDLHSDLRQMDNHIDDDDTKRLLLDRTSSTNNDDAIFNDHVDDEQEGQEALWVEPDFCNDDAASLSSLGTPIRAEAPTTPRSLSLFARKNRSAAGVMPDVPPPQLAAAAAAAAPADLPSPLQKKRSSTGGVGLFKSRSRRVSAPHIVLLGTYDHNDLNATTNQQQVRVPFGRSARSNFASRAASATAAATSRKTPELASTEVPHVIPASDTISSLGFDKSFDQHEIKGSNAIHNVHSSTSPLSMSSLNAIMDGPVTPAGAAAAATGGAANGFSAAAANEKKGLLKSWGRKQPSGSSGKTKAIAAGAAAGATTLVVVSSPKGSGWKKWKATRRGGVGGANGGRLSPRDTARIQRYTATVVDKSGANAANHLDDSFEEDPVNNSNPRLDMAVVEMDAHLQRAIRLAMDNDDAQSLTSYDGVSLHTSPEELKKQQQRNKRATAVLETEAAPNAKPARFDTLHPTFITAGKSNPAALLTMAKSWEEENESLAQEETTPVSTSEGDTLTSSLTSPPGVASIESSKEDSQSRESDSAVSSSPNGATAAMMMKQNKLKSSTSASLATSEPVDLDITVDDEDDSQNAPPATPLNLLPSPASSGADSTDKYTVTGSGSGEGQRSRGRSFSDDDDDTGGAATDKYSVLSDPCSFCDSLWISASKNQGEGQYTNSTMSSSPTSVSPVVESDKYTDSFKTRQTSSSGGIDGSNAVTAASIDKYSELPDMVPSSSSGLSSRSGQDETTKEKVQKSPMRLAAAAGGAVTGLLGKFKRTPTRKSAALATSDIQPTAQSRAAVIGSAAAVPAAATATTTAFGLGRLSPARSVKNNPRTPPRAAAVAAASPITATRSFSKSPLMRNRKTAAAMSATTPVPATTTAATPPHPSVAGSATAPSPMMMMAMNARQFTPTKNAVTPTRSIGTPTRSGTTPTKSILKEPKIAERSVHNVEPPPSIERYHRVSTEQLLETDDFHRVTVITSDATDDDYHNRNKSNTTGNTDNSSSDNVDKSATYGTSDSGPVEDASSTTESSSGDEDGSAQGNNATTAAQQGSDRYQQQPVNHPLVDRIKKRQQQQSQRSRGLDPETTLGRGGSEIVGRLQLDP